METLASDLLDVVRALVHEEIERSKENVLDSIDRERVT